MNRNKSIDLFKLQSLVFILSLTAIFGKLITLPTLQLVLIRTLIAVSAFFILFLYRKEKINARGFIRMLMVGGVLGLHWICFFGSAKLSNVSISLVTLSLMAFFTSILEPLSTRKPIQKYQVFIGLLATCGMSFIFFSMPEHKVGIWVGIIAAALSSVYTVANKRLVEKHSSVSINTIELLGAFIICLCITLASRKATFFEMPSYLNLFYLFVLAIGCTFFPYLAMVKLLKRFTAFTINLSLNMEPIYGILIAWLLFNEATEFGWRFYVGFGIIIFAMAMNGQKKALSTWLRRPRIFFKA